MVITKADRLFRIPDERAVRFTIVIGRWNPPGTPLIYTSMTPELALLETLVHLDV